MGDEDTRVTKRRAFTASYLDAKTLRTVSDVEHVNITFLYETEAKCIEIQEYKYLLQK